MLVVMEKLGLLVGAVQDCSSNVWKLWSLRAVVTNVEVFKW